ncbi:alcohol dehydrogenase catalytic domain-containing protein [Rhodococcus sp. CSLK01-03]|uniref:Alcohol dehydrogenase catalytic domain-containing protein n=1 Tax=Rhodococcus indonesiensis TaxID=3055869 RepID=A0ABT7RQ10_9NOCA|nr:alcohol dehydrogenase catalytic domain-containing protein [Rhodococcus indonesiensis]MDM7489359.1 alcohol dehydrogenase catalytic domain-containing protein [Rhodococcus indonesiensis]
MKNNIVFVVGWDGRRIRNGSKDHDVRELNFLGTGRLGWIDRPAPTIQTGTDAVVRPFVLGRCDGDTLPLHHRVSRAMQVGLAIGVVDSAVGDICGAVPFAPPFALGHECIAEVVEVGADVGGLRTGDKVVVPWSVACGQCDLCRRGLTSKCLTTRRVDDGMRMLAAYGFGAASGNYGGMASDLVRVPFAEHMLVRLPDGLDPLRVAAASDNLSDAWRTVVPHLRNRPDATVLVVGGGARSIGLYAAGLARAHGAAVVDYVDSDQDRLELAAALGADAGERSHSPHPLRRTYDIVVEASSRPAGIRYAIRATAPGGVCTAVGYYVAATTGVPLMHMYANDITLHLGVSHPHAVLPELLDWVHRHDFPAEIVTTRLAGFDEAPTAYLERTTKLVLHRPPLS